MMRSMYSGVSGLKTHQTKMDVIGNNIANVNTVAFKSNSITFSELMYQTTQKASGANQLTGTGGINARQIGLGVKSAAISTAIKNQGATQTTGNPFDISISGESFFIVSDGRENMFTRAGAFNVDAVGNLVMSSNGFNVMGWQANDETQTIKKDNVSALRIMSPDNMTYPPEATTAGYVSGIIDKRDPNVSSEGGKVISLNFYDDLGYQYTAKFGVHSTLDDGKFFVTLDDIFYTDENNKTRSVTQDYPGASLSDIVQVGNGVGSTFNVGTTKALAGSISTASLAVSNDGGTTYVSNGRKAVLSYDTTTTDANTGNPVVTTTYYVLPTDSSDNLGKTNTAPDAASLNGTDSARVTAAVQTFKTEDLAKAEVKEMIMGLYGFSEAEYATLQEVEIDLTGKGTLTVNKQNVKGAATLLFSPDDGTFTRIDDGTTGGKDATINLVFNEEFVDSSTTPATTYNLRKFHNIEMDWSATNMFNNNGTSTVGATSGDKNGLNSGRKLGKMSGITIQTNGEIYASYDNGMTRLLGQIAVAEFTNAAGLEKAGENLYKSSLNSGEFDGVGVDITGSGGSMSTGVLEMSNVDLSAEFTEMITTQRGFQATSRIITVSHTMLEELVNLKR